MAGPGRIVFTTAEQLFVVQTQTRIKDIKTMIDLKRLFLILKFNYKDYTIKNSDGFAVTCIAALLAR